MVVGKSRVAARGMAASALSRGLAALAPLLVVPVSLSYLGVDLYGAWAAALSLTGLIAFSDLGIGNGLMTRIGALTAPEDRDAARRLVSSAYAMMTMICVFLLVLLWGSAPLLDWPALIGPTASGEPDQIEVIVLITFSAFIVLMVTNLVVRAQYGLQQVVLSNLWQAAGSALSVVAVYGAAALDPGAGSFVAMAAFTPVIISLANTAQFFLRGRGRAVRPSMSHVERSEMRGLLGIGSRFLVIFILMSIGTSLDTWIVSRTASLAEATSFAIPSRVMATVGILIPIFAAPLWPLHVKAVSEGDHRWMRRITRRMTIISTSAVLSATTIAALLAPRLLDDWLGQELAVPGALWWGLALWWTVQAAASAAFMAQNGAEVLRPQTVGYLLFALVLPVKWIAAENWGMASVPFVGAVAYALLLWPSCWIGYRRALALARERVRGASQP